MLVIIGDNDVVIGGMTGVVVGDWDFWVPLLLSFEASMLVVVGGGARDDGDDNNRCRLVAGGMVIRLLRQNAARAKESIDDDRGIVAATISIGKNPSDRRIINTPR